MTIKLSRRNPLFLLMTEFYEVPEYQIDFCRLFWGVAILPVIGLALLVALPFVLIAKVWVLRAAVIGLAVAAVIVTAVLAGDLLVALVLALLILLVVGAAFIGFLVGAMVLAEGAVRRGVLNGVTTRAYPAYRWLKFKTCPMVEVTGIAPSLGEAAPSPERDQAAHRAVLVDTRPLNVGGPDLEMKQTEVPK